MKISKVKWKIKKPKKKSIHLKIKMQKWGHSYEIRVLQTKGYSRIVMSSISSQIAAFLFKDIETESTVSPSTHQTQVNSNVIIGICLLPVAKQMYYSYIPRVTVSCYKCSGSGPKRNL